MKRIAPLLYGGVGWRWIWKDLGCRISQLSTFVTLCQVVCVQQGEVKSSDSHPKDDKSVPNTNEYLATHHAGVFRSGSRLTFSSTSLQAFKQAQHGRLIFQYCTGHLCCQVLVRETVSTRAFPLIEDSVSPALNRLSVCSVLSPHQRGRQQPIYHQPRKLSPKILLCNHARSAHIKRCTVSSPWSLHFFSPGHRSETREHTKSRR